MKISVQILFAFLFLNLFTSCQSDGFEWKEGDILFQDGDCGDFCEAIRKVTQGYQGRSFTHNGLLIRENGDWYVLEAISKGVSQTPLDSFLLRYDGEQSLSVGRLKPEYHHLIPDAIHFAKAQIGKAYDHAFDFENDAFYCSELIHFAFKTANENIDLFEPQPMTYIDPETGSTFSVWISYFDELGIPIPEGVPGLNPGGMSMAQILEMKEIPLPKKPS